MVVHGYLHTETHILMIIPIVNLLILVRAGREVRGKMLDYTLIQMIIPVTFLQIFMKYGYLMPGLIIRIKHFHTTITGIVFLEIVLFGKMPRGRLMVIICIYIITLVRTICIMMHLLSM